MKKVKLTQINELAFICNLYCFFLGTKRLLYVSVWVTDINISNFVPESCKPLIYRLNLSL